MGERWAAHIDVLDFAAKWDDTTMEPFRGINALMEGILKIGEHYFREPPDRLFAHQFGDAFLVVSEFHEERLTRAALLVVALMRHVLAAGALARATISEGGLSDIVGCYPSYVRDNNDGSSVPCGHGLMTIFPVMGTALIRTVGIDKQEPRGPLVLLENKNAGRVDEFAVTPCGNELATLDWIHSEHSELRRLQTASALHIQDETGRIATLTKYVSASAMSEKSKSAIRQYLRVHGI